MENQVQTSAPANNADLGFGSVVTKESRARLLNKDGSFNIKRTGLPVLCSMSAYHSLLSMSWISFISVIVVIYFLTNLIFALGYLACGPNSIVGPSEFSPFVSAFFFSIQTFATIGYGQLTPNGIAANMLVAIEALTGLLGFALATGLLFARFSRPTARIMFSKQALIAPYRGISSFQFRMTNARKNQLLNLEVQVVYSQFEGTGSSRKRNFYILPLERERVAFFPLSWTVVHPIDANSPLYNRDQNSLREAQPEFLVLLSAFDETFSQTVHARSSYTFPEIEFNAKFISPYLKNSDGEQVGIDVSLLSAYERLS